ncbi:MAG: beta-ketoacyl-[acyl-carrier-protein] synthase family protein [Holophagales bacterium]|nr:beta-ketoacyl-[acyl-carrier-protein] synthase family protein [Holophagales bacterium]
MERVVISGVGVGSPIGCTHREFLRRLFAGRSGIGPLRRFDAGPFRSSLAAELSRDHLETASGPLAHEIQRMDRFVHLALAAARQAMDDSGRPGDDPSRGGVFLGLGMGGLPHMEGGVVRQGTRGPRKTTPYLIPSLIPSMAAGMISLDLGVEGCQQTFASACSSGSQALGEAVHAIRTGRVDWALAGGTEAVITPITFSGFEAMRALALTDDPERAPLPLDSRRNGMVVGEGAAVFVLESAAGAGRRDARPRAAMTGYATVSGGDGILMRSASAAERAMRAALADAGLEPARIDGIFSQAMGLPNDDRELDAIRAVFGDPGPTITSIEGHLGHTFGASGPLGLAAALGAFERREIPPTLGFERPTSGYEMLDIAGESRPRRVENCLINTYGFGGLNASLICSVP